MEESQPRKRLQLQAAAEDSHQRSHHNSSELLAAAAGGCEQTLLCRRQRASPAAGGCESGAKTSGHRKHHGDVSVRGPTPGQLGREGGARCDGQIGEEAEPEAEHALGPVFWSLEPDYAELRDPVQ